MADLIFCKQIELVSLLAEQLINDCREVDSETNKFNLQNTVLGPSAMHDKIVRLRNELITLDKALKGDKTKFKLNSN